MNYLLDTHVFLWWDSEPEKLSPAVADLLRQKDNQIVLSVASVWEMQIKAQAGKLRLSLPLETIIADHQERNGISVLPVGLSHVLALQTLPIHHKDPFDRLLAAQAKAENLVLVSADRRMKSYVPELVW